MECTIHHVYKYLDTKVLPNFIIIEIANIWEFIQLPSFEFREFSHAFKFSNIIGY